MIDLSRFWDVVLSHRDVRIVSILYRKPRSGTTLLFADSGHPRHVTRGIPVGQFLRLSRISSDASDFQQESDEMSGRFSDHGYTWHLHYQERFTSLNGHLESACYRTLSQNLVQ